MIDEKGIHLDLTKEDTETLCSALAILEDIKKKVKDSNKKYIYTLNDDMFACELFDVMECTYTIYALINDKV